jgi:thiosulfate sulfurtransferase
MNMSHITSAELALWQAQGFDFELLDVRRAGVRAEHGAQIDGAHWHDPAAWLDWKDSVGTQRPAVLYCAKGHEIGQGLTAALRALGVDARYLVGGMQGWLAEGRPTEPLAAAGERP